MVTIDALDVHLEAGFTVCPVNRPGRPSGLVLAAASGDADRVLVRDQSAGWVERAVDIPGTWGRTLEVDDVIDDITDVLESTDARPSPMQLDLG